MINGDIFNAYSQYFDILENVGSYSSANTARLLLASFIQDMKNSGFVKTLSEEDKKFLQKLEDCIQNKLCILPYTSTCMKKKVYKIFNGGYESCVTYNKKAALKYPYAPNITLDIYSPTDTAQVMEGNFNFDTYIKTESADYDLWFYVDAYGSRTKVWFNISQEFRDNPGINHFYFVGEEIGEFYGDIYFYLLSNGEYKFEIRCDMHNGDNRNLAMLNAGETLQGNLYYKITQPNDTFDLGLIEVIANGRDRDRTPNWIPYTHISCEVDLMGRQTGNSTDLWKDTNVFSETYNQEEERTTSRPDVCVDRTPHWEILTESCELNGSGYNTGRYTVVRIDTNPNSASYGTTETTSSINYTKCPLNAPNWVLQSSYCQTSGGNNTGYRIDVYKDTNVNSATYNTTRESSPISDLNTCPTASTDPVWTETIRTCLLSHYTHSADPSEGHYNGTASVIYEDTNINSPTHGQTREESPVVDTVNCAAENVGYIEFQDSSTTLAVSYNYAQRTAVIIPIRIWKNDVQMTNVGNASIVSSSLVQTPGIVSGGIRFNLPKNTTGVDRTGTIIVEEQCSDGTKQRVTVNITQTGNPTFAWTGHANPYNITGYTNQGGTETIGVTSLAGDTFLNYTVQSYSSGLQAPTIDNSGNLVVVIPQNQAISVKNFSIVIKQNNTDSTLTLNIQQQAATPVDTYTFEWTGEGTGNKSMGTNLSPISYQETMQAFSITSLKNGNPWQFAKDNSSTADFVTVDIDDVDWNSVELTAEENRTTERKTGTVVFRQDTNGQSNYLTVNVVQEHYPYETLQVVASGQLVEFPDGFTVSTYIDEDDVMAFAGGENIGHEQYSNVIKPTGGCWVSFPKDVRVGAEEVAAGEKYEIQSGITSISITYVAP